MDTSPSSAGSSGDDSPVRRMSRKISRTLKSGQRDAQLFVRKPRNMVAVGLFCVVFARIVHNHLREHWVTQELLSSFDSGHDHLLNSAEMVKLLRANGLDMSNDQVGKFFGRVDDEGDGFDMGELEQILNIVAHLPAASERIRHLAAGRSIFIDTVLIAVSGAGLAYLVMHSDAVEKKWAASSFHNAVLYRRMQAKCSKLDKKIEELSAERAKLEEDIHKLETQSGGDLLERDEQLKVLNGRLERVRSDQEDARKQLEREVAKWQHEAERSMREASMTTQKMERMMTCIKGLGTCVKGLEAFTGTGKGEFNSLGAQSGFCSVQRSIGFSMDSITFGTIEDGDNGRSGELRLYETSSSRKLGEGKDCAYRCTELTTGKELALKMYKINKKEQRRTIYHDLYAHKSQVGRHPRIVSYERVIESENMIFVLMELIAGKDLFDVVVSQALTEELARPLFTELVEGLQHLHGNGVIHCDVKPENAMVVGNVNAGAAHVKLIDFGCSCFTQFESSQEGCVVWDCYMPPEHAANPKLMPGVATDMWRLGCTLYVMLMRRPPFHNDAETRWGMEARENARFCKDPPYDTLSIEAKDLLASLIIGDPSKRLGTAQVLQHPWVLGRTTN